MSKAMTALITKLPESKRSKNNCLWSDTKDVERWPSCFSDNTVLFFLLKFDFIQRVLIYFGS